MKNEAPNQAATNADRALQWASHAMKEPAMIQPEVSQAAQCAARMRSYFGAQPWLSEATDDPVFGIIQHAMDAAVASAKSTWDEQDQAHLATAGQEVARLTLGTTEIKIEPKVLVN